VASSNETPCLRRLVAAFSVSHSNTVQYIQNESAALSRPVLGARHPHPRCPQWRACRNTAPFISSDPLLTSSRGDLGPLRGTLREPECLSDRVGLRPK
jgi:hypothetical protein